jgi:hypothetical protein
MATLNVPFLALCFASSASNCAEKSGFCLTASKRKSEIGFEAQKRAEGEAPNEKRAGSGRGCGAREIRPCVDEVGFGFCGGFVLVQIAAEKLGEGVGVFSRLDSLRK